MDRLAAADIVELYDSTGVEQAVERSAFRVAARDGGALVGVVR